MHLFSKHFFIYFFLIWSSQEIKTNIFDYKYINIYRYQLIKTDFLFFSLSLFFLISYLWRIYKYFVFSKYISLHISWNLFIIFCGNDSIWGHFWYFTWFLFFIFKILFWNFWKFPNGNQVFLRELCLTTLILIICCLCHFQWTLPPYQYFTIPPFTLSLVLL